MASKLHDPLPDGVNHLNGVKLSVLDHGRFEERSVGSIPMHGWHFTAVRTFGYGRGSEAVTLVGFSWGLFGGVEISGQVEVGRLSTSFEFGSPECLSAFRR